MSLVECVVPQTEGTATTLTSPPYPKPTNEELADFYRGLKSELAAELQQAAVQIHNRITRTYLEMGRDLLTAKDKLPHGQFLRWVLLEFKIIPRQAERLMAAANLWAKNDNLLHFPKSVVYRLAAKSCPESVRRHYLERLESGERPRVADVAAAIAAAKPARAKSRKSCSRTKPATIVEEVTTAAPSSSPAAPDPELVRRAHRVALQLLSVLGTPETLWLLDHINDVAAAAERVIAKSPVQST